MDPNTGKYLELNDYVRGDEPWLAPVLCISNDPEFDKRDYSQLQQHNEHRWYGEKCFVKVR